jgi:2-polyprenyl-3-methyl-5-hydroxy-6-metoxy-1,4-benzoquinol methylase
MHNLIIDKASDVDGVDIEPAGIRKLKERGYSVFPPEELKSKDKKYDIIVISDVIEHVNDPVAFLKFYSGFLNKDGRILITTPNAHGIRNFTSIMFRNNYSVNSEHTLWLCPKTIMEVTVRAHLEFVDFYWLDEYFSIHDVKGIFNRLQYGINSCFQRIRTNFNPNFLFIVSK